MSSESFPLLPPPETDHVHVIEALLQTPFFYDDERSALLYDSPHQLRNESLGARWSLGMSALRLLADSRHEDRIFARQRSNTLKAKEWNTQYAYTARRIGQIAFEHKEEVRFLSRQMALVNVAERSLKTEAMDKLSEGSRGRQRTYLEDIVGAITEAPRQAEFWLRDGDRADLFLRGASVIAPTGYGKTRLMGLMLRALGVGRPLDDLPHAKDPVRALIIEPSQDLIDQMAGVTGDKTFERAAGIQPGRYFQHSKQKENAAVLITPAMFLRDFRDYSLLGEEFDVLAIDETHILTQPQLFAAIRHHWRGPVFGFTATPSYEVDTAVTKEHVARDVTKILPRTIEHDDLISCIDEGVLNGAQIFTLAFPRFDRYGSQRHVYDDDIEELVIDFLRPLLQEGRRGIVFCNPGSHSLYARRLAEKLSSIPLGEGRMVNAKAIGHRILNSSAIIDEYHKGTVDVITTVNKGHLGLNGNFDFVYNHRDHDGSKLILLQKIGRGTRLSDTFPFTIYGQTLLMGTVSDRHSYTLYEVMGLEEVEQGRTISNRMHSGWWGRGPVKLERFSPAIRHNLAAIDKKAIGKLLMTPEGDGNIPEDYVSFERLLTPSGYSRARALQKLNEAQLNWIGKRVPGKHQMERFYEPSASDILPPRRPQISLPQLAERYGLHRNTIIKIIHSSSIDLNTEFLKRKVHYSIDLDRLDTLDALVDEKFPYQQAGEMTSAALMKELNIKDEAEIVNIAKAAKINKVRRRLQDGKGTGDFYTKIHSGELRKLVAEKRRQKNQYDIAPEGAMSPGHILEKLGLRSWKALFEQMNQEEKDQAEPRFMTDKRGRLGLRPKTWTKEQGEAIVARIQAYRAART